MRGVEGVVSVSGRVILCEYGFRAEHMGIEALVLRRDTFEILGDTISLVEPQEKLAKRYGVPLIEPDEVQGFCSERGVVLGSQEAPRPEIGEVAARLAHLQRAAASASYQVALFPTPPEPTSPLEHAVRPIRWFWRRYPDRYLSEAVAAEGTSPPGRAFWLSAKAYLVGVNCMAMPFNLLCLLAAAIIALVGNIDIAFTVATVPLGWIASFLIIAPFWAWVHH